MALLSFALIMGVLIFTDTVSWWMGIVLVGLAALVLAPTQQTGARFSAAQFSHFAWKMSPLSAVMAVALIQVNHWRLSNVQGFRLWTTQAAVAADPSMVSLREAVDWIRTNTPPESIFVANAFCEQNLRGGSLARLDNTTVDKYYYYSAFAERRFWVEGPTYLCDQCTATRRIATASKLFSGGAPALLFEKEKGRPDYILLDHALNDGARVQLSAECRVFENDRISVYRLDPPLRDAKERIVATSP